MPVWHNDTPIHKGQRLKDHTEIYIRPIAYLRLQKSTRK